MYYYVVFHWFRLRSYSVFFFFTPLAPPEFYTLSLHDALPISSPHSHSGLSNPGYGSALPQSRSYSPISTYRRKLDHMGEYDRSEEHTSELQSRGHLVCRLLLEKKKNQLNKKNP